MNLWTLDAEIIKSSTLKYFPTQNNSLLCCMNYIWDESNYCVITKCVVWGRWVCFECVCTHVSVQSSVTGWVYGSSLPLSGTSPPPARITWGAGEIVSLATSSQSGFLEARVLNTHTPTAHDSDTQGFQGCIMIFWTIGDHTKWVGSERGKVPRDGVLGGWETLQTVWNLNFSFGAEAEGGHRMHMA